MKKKEKRRKTAKKEKKKNKKTKLLAKRLKTLSKADKKIHRKLSSLEVLMKEILEHKKVNKKEIEKHAKKIKLKHIIGGKTKISHLNRLEKKVKAIHKRLHGAKELPAPQDMQEIKDIATEITKHRIITDFDRVLFFVNEHKKAKAGQIAKELQIEKKRVEDCAKILEENGLIELDYPLIGDLILEINDYRQKMKKEQKKKIAKKK